MAVQSGASCTTFPVLPICSCTAYHVHGVDLQHRHILVFIITHHLGRLPLPTRKRDLRRPDG